MRYGFPVLAPAIFLTSYQQIGGKKMAEKIENVITWSRSEISSCNCDAKSYRHVHCPCSTCNGRAVDRRSELRHWNEACVVAKQANMVADDICARGQEDLDLSISSSEENISDDLMEQDFDQMDEQSSNYFFKGESGILDDSMSSETSNSSNSDQTINPMRELVVKSVLDALRIAKDSGSSIKTFEEILEYGKKLLLTSIDSKNVDREIILTLWPKNWIKVQTLLKEEGYEDAKLYYICICREHQEKTRSGKSYVKVSYSGKYSVLGNKDDLCPHCGKKGYLKYYYLGLCTKVKHWFKSSEMCEKMLSHWKARDRWNASRAAERSEIWDGDRWSELRWFWDPNSSWILPAVCPLCRIPVSSDHLVNSEEGVNGCKNVECPNCGEDFEHNIQTVKGSPLNVALIGHWDGWQPFGTSYRGSGSVEISIANMTKDDRNHIDEVYVIGFIPCHEVPNLPEALDPFLKPLMEDITTGFVNGFKVSYPSGVKIEGFQPQKEETIRVLILCWTGDHPAQCEVGKFLNQGRCGCRRCKMIGKQLENSNNNHIYYGENRYHFRFPWETRDIESSIDDMYHIDHETRASVRKTQASKKGFTGTSILHTYLYPLYGFNIIKHMVIDTFHTIPLNVVKNQLERLLQKKRIDQSYLDDQLKTFPWTPDLKDGRVPRMIGNCKGVGQWKADGLRKFSFPMADCILMGKLPDKESEIQSLISRLTEMHFYDGRNGWNDDMIALHEKLAWRLNIIIEEVQGLEMCTISLHNLVHIHEDIMNFSSPDNYWCAVYERAVKEYIKKSHNCKGIESTFAQSEARREFLKSLHTDAKKDVQSAKVNIQAVSLKLLIIMIFIYFFFIYLRSIQLSQ